MLQRSHWLLLTIAAAGENPLSPTQLQKALFLLSKGMPEEDRAAFYSFRPYFYGPFCSDVYHDADELERDGTIAIIRPLGGGLRKFAATFTGRGLAFRLAERAPAELVKYVRDVVAWVQSLTFEQLLTAIYEQYPEMRKNSVFVE